MREWSGVGSCGPCVTSAGSGGSGGIRGCRGWIPRGHFSVQVADLRAVSSELDVHFLSKSNYIVQGGPRRPTMSYMATQGGSKWSKGCPRDPKGTQSRSKGGKGCRMTPRGATIHKSIYTSNKIYAKSRSTANAMVFFLIFRRVSIVCSTFLIIWNILGGGGPQGVWRNMYQ